MATIVKILAAIVFFTLIGKGYCHCTLDSIIISQSKMGNSVENKQKWNVTIFNSCTCTQKDLKLSCNGFQTAEKIDPSVLAISGNECLVNNGNPVYFSTTFNFSYVWDTSFPFEPISSQISCS